MASLLASPQKAGVYACQRGGLTSFSGLKEKLNALLIYAGQRRYSRQACLLPKRHARGKERHIAHDAESVEQDADEMRDALSTLGEVEIPDATKDRSTKKGVEKRHQPGIVKRWCCGEV